MDPAECRRSFDALSASGKVIQPLFDSPWGSLFGVVQDELGVNWMFDCTKKPAS
jgi:PhnB protein